MQIFLVVSCIFKKKKSEALLKQYPVVCVVWAFFVSAISFLKMSHLDRLKYTWLDFISSTQLFEALS